MISEHINKAKQELKVYVNSFCGGEYHWPEKNVLRVLNLLYEEINEEDQNPRVFAAFRDICVVSIRNYENTELGNTIHNLSVGLEKESEIYRNVGILGLDFGKQDPI